jgi:hypothetical protein
MWQILYPAIVDAQTLQTCETLLKWIKVISTGSTLGKNATGLPTTALDLQVPLMDQALINHRAVILKQFLPVLSQPLKTLEHALSQMAAAVLQNTNDNQLACDKKLTREQTPKLHSEKYTVTLNILLENLEIANEQKLPKLWHNWSKCTKRQEFQVLT